MKVKALVVALVFLIIGGSTVAFAAWDGLEPTHATAAAEGLAESTPSPLTDNFAILVVGVIGLRLARQHLRVANGEANDK